MFDTKRLTWQSLVAHVKQIQINLSTCTIYQVVSCSGHLLCCVLSLRQWQSRARMVHWLFQACNLPCVLVTTGTLTASSSDYRCNPWLWSGFQVPITPSMTFEDQEPSLVCRSFFLPWSWCGTSCRHWRHHPHALWWLPCPRGVIPLCRWVVEVSLISVLCILYYLGSRRGWIWWRGGCVMLEVRMCILPHYVLTFLFIGWSRWWSQLWRGHVHGDHPLTQWQWAIIHML